MKTKRMICCFILVVLLFTSVLGLSTLAADEMQVPNIKIASANLSLDDNIYIYFRAYYDSINTDSDSYGMIIWTAEQAEGDYTYANAQNNENAIIYGSTSNWRYLEEIGKDVATYSYKIAAKQMADVVYAQAYTQKDGVYYYSDIVKYGAGMYASRKLGLVDGVAGTTEQSLQDLLRGMLEYGALAQKHFNYNTGFLATEYLKPSFTVKFYDSDGSTLLKKEIVMQGYSPTPPTLPDQQCLRWSGWSGDYTNITANADLVAQYETAHTEVIDQAVAPTCSATGLTEGKHCSACGEVIIAQEVVAATGKHDFSEWETVKEATTSEEGLMERSCDCGEKETQIIEKIIPELEYALNDDGESYSVTGIGTWVDAELVIPDTYKGLPVTRISQGAFRNCNTLTHVTIPDSVTDIGSWAFDGCSNLPIENGVSYADTWAVDWDGSLSTAILRENTIGIGGDVFASSAITSVVIPCSVKYICDFALYNCEKITEVSIGGQVKHIGRYAFFMCDSLVNVTIDDSVTASIGYCAFGDCNSLSNVIIGDKVSGIGEGAFSSCNSLTGVIIGNSVTFIGEAAFSNCESLTSITIPNSVTSIGNRVFEDCFDLASITIGKSVVSIGEYAFPYKLMDSPTAIYYCGTLDDWNKIVIGKNFDDYRIYYYSKTQPASKCSNWWHYVDGIPTIYSHIEVIDEAVAPTCTESGFSEGTHCSACGAVIVSQKVVPAAHTYGEPVIKEPSCDANGYAVYNCYCGASYGEEIIPSNFEVTADNRHLVGYTGKSGEKLVIPAVFESDGTWYRVTGIGANAFEKCSGLTSITLPDSVTTIGENAFKSCTNLTAAEIGNGVTGIGDYAFYYCKALENLPTSNSLKSIGAHAFNSCYGLTSIVIPENVTSIGSYAFQYCKYLKDVIISENVTWIGACAFLDCYKLSRVTFKDTSTWYRTPPNGAYTSIAMNVTDSSANVGYFLLYHNSTYNSYYNYNWFKK